MENYKKINSELIEQVQEMRIHVAAYQRELVELRTQLINEHRLRVEQKQRFIELITQSYRQTLEEIEPDANILKLLQLDASRIEAENNKSRRSSNAQFGNIRQARGRRSSAGISQDLRRSLALHRLSNVVSVSPIRRCSTTRFSGSSEDMQEMETDLTRNETVEAVETESDHNNDEDDKDCKSDVDVSNTTAETSQETAVETSEVTLEPAHLGEDEQTSMQNARLCSIAEADDEEEEQQQHEQSLENVPTPDITTRARRKRRNAMVYQCSSPMRDLTNVETTTVTPRTTPTATPKTPTTTPREVHIVVRRGKRRSAHNESIEAMRFINHCERLSTPPRAPSACTNCSPSFATSDLSSSTPNNNKKQQQQTLQLTQTTDNNIRSSSNSNSTLRAATAFNSTEMNISRPRRNCTPTNFVEPNLRCKMRNEKSSEKEKKISKGRKCKTKQ